jgi:hypothetical protein
LLVLVTRNVSDRHEAWMAMGAVSLGRGEPDDGPDRWLAVNTGLESSQRRTVAIVGRGYCRCRNRFSPFDFHQRAVHFEIASNSGLPFARSWPTDGMTPQMRVR